MKKSQFSRLSLPALAAITLAISSTLIFAQGGGGAAGRGGIPNLTPAQISAINAMDQALTAQTSAAATARTALIAASFAEPRNDTDLKARLEQLDRAELALANARAEQFTKLQAGADKLNAEQISALIAISSRIGGGGPRVGGRGGNQDPGMVFTRPTESPGLGKPMELPKPDADGFVSMFNGRDLTGWDALPNFWSVKNGVIDCVETGEEGGNIQSDLIWMDSQEHPEKYANFELRVKFRWISHSGNSGVQFRGIMDRADTKHIGGYQADFDPQNAFTGGLYDESGKAGRHQSGQGPHMGPRGYKTTYSADGGAARLEPLAENNEALAAVVKPVGGDFNELVVIADGSHLTIKVNDHVFAEVIDEYPSALKSGIIAFQQHAGAQMEIQFKDPKIKFL